MIIIPYLYLVGFFKNYLAKDSISKNKKNRIYSFLRLILPIYMQQKGLALLRQSMEL